MVTTLLAHSRIILAPLAGYMDRAQTWVDGLLVQADGAPPMEEGQKKSGGLPTWAIIAIVAGVLVLCVMPICVIAVLTLLGPAIGNVFSNVQEGIQ